MADKMFTTWDGMDVHAKVADRANADADGNSLTLGLDASGKVATIGGKEIAGGGGGGASYTSGDGISISEENEINVKTDGSTIHTNASGELEVIGGGGGGGGGLSPITPTILTPVVENGTYKITIPGNNAYYMVTLDEGYNVEIEPPTLNEGELFNIILLIETTDGNDKTMTIPDYYDRGILPMTEQTQWGWVYGIGLTQFVFLGKGYTMTTSAYFSG
jgi:hypothetical protein